jgi:stage III sporulation protein SpoIIIAA
MVEEQEYRNKVYSYARENGGEIRLSLLGHKFGSTRQKFKKSMQKVLKEDEQSRFTISFNKSYECCTVLSNLDTAAEVVENALITKKKFQLADRTLPYYYLEKSSELEIAVKRILKFLDDNDDGLPGIISVCCRKIPDGIEILQIATEKDVYLVDCRLIGGQQACDLLQPLFGSEKPIKLIHDLHKNALALHKLGQIQILGVLDTQLLAELIWKSPSIDFNEFLSKLNLPNYPSWDFYEERGESGVNPWSNRPIAQASLEHAAQGAACLQNTARHIFSLEQWDKNLESLLDASASRVKLSIEHPGERSLCFDKTHGFAPASAELMRVTRPNDGFYGEPLEIESNVEEILSILPPIYTEKFQLRKERAGILDLSSKKSASVSAEEEGALLPIEELRDIILDIWRRPQCWMKDSRVFLCNELAKVVEEEEVNAIVAKLGTFGSDNRAGLGGAHRNTGSLHRFSAIKDREGGITGITIRVGRNVRGNASMLMDLMMNYPKKSILILGEPGSGKTTIVREATRKLAEEQNVIVVDTSNEIAGDGKCPHSCIGHARRMMVPSLDQQGSVMIECVQNHTPHVMVIDEIGRPREVKAADTVKQRGVRMIASAHGDLRTLLKNGELNRLVGGLETVTIGDEMAKERAKQRRNEHLDDCPASISKTVTQRKSAPTFEIIVEVSRDSRDEWRIVHDSAKAVDRILEGRSYTAQLRRRNPITGEMWMNWVDA